MKPLTTSASAGRYSLQLGQKTATCNRKGHCIDPALGRLAYLDWTVVGLHTILRGTPINLGHLLGYKGSTSTYRTHAWNMYMSRRESIFRTGLEPHVFVQSWLSPLLFERGLLNSYSIVYVLPVDIQNRAGAVELQHYTVSMQNFGHKKVRPF